MDMATINDDLLEVREALALRERLERDLARAEQNLKEERERLRELAATLGDEEEDVRRLEGISFVGLFYAVMGTKETRLQEERQELLAAQLKYENARRRVAALEEDVKDLRRRLAGMRDLPERYEALLAQKEALLRASGSEISQKLEAISEKLAAARIEARELDEAVQAGEQAQAGLNNVVAALESAKNWGTWDMLGGGVIASAVKHSRLDEAHAAVQAVQPLLQRFERELADVGPAFGLNIEAGGLTAFADIFMDGLLVDLLVQSKINDSLNASRQMAERVRSLLARLVRRQAEVHQVVRSLEEDRRRHLQ